MTLYEHQTKNTDKERRAELRALLKAELEDTLERFRAMPGGGTGKGKRYVVHLQPLTLEQAATSGLFPVAQVQEMLALASAIRTYDVKAAHVLDPLTKHTPNATNCW